MAVEQPWILMTSQPFGCRCTRCGGVWTVGLPSSIGVVLAAGKAFTEQHTACQERKEATGCQ